MKKPTFKFSFVAALFMNWMSMEMPQAGGFWDNIPSRFRPGSIQTQIDHSYCGDMTE